MYVHVGLGGGQVSVRTCRASRWTSSVHVGLAGGQVSVRTCRARRWTGQCTYM